MNEKIYIYKGFNGSYGVPFNNYMEFYICLWGRDLAKP